MGQDRQGDVCFTDAADRHTGYAEVFKPVEENLMQSSIKLAALALAVAALSSCQNLAAKSGSDQSISTSSSKPSNIIN